MVKRAKRLKKGIESLKEQIEKHFDKLEMDIQEQNIERGIYPFNEINKGLLKALKIKIDILATQDTSVKDYKEKLEKFRKLLGLKEDEL